MLTINSTPRRLRRLVGRISSHTFAFLGLCLVGAIITALACGGFWCLGIVAISLGFSTEWINVGQYPEFEVGAFLFILAGAVAVLVYLIGLIGAGFINLWRSTKL